MRIPFIEPWNRLSPTSQGIAWILLSGFLFALMGLLTKILGNRLDSFQIAFFRTLFGFLAISPFILAGGRAVFHTQKFKLHLARGTLGAVGLMTMFYALTHLPLADATAYGFSRALFVVLAARFFLGEAIRARRLGATAVGFIGVLVMLRPTGEVNPAAFVALFGAATVAGIVVLIKKLSQTERPVTVMAYFGVISTALTFVPALIFWKTPTLHELAMLMAIGTVGAAAQGASIRAVKVADASVVMSFDYMQLLYAIGLGFLFLGETPDAWMLGGALIVIASGLYIARREARLRREQKIESSLERAALADAPANPDQQQGGKP